MTVTQCMQDIAICLLKCMQPVNKDQIICGGRINGIKERIA
jgi:hypothetical protein